MFLCASPEWMPFPMVLQLAEALQKDPTHFAAIVVAIPDAFEHELTVRLLLISVTTSAWNFPLPRVKCCKGSIASA